MFLCVCVCACVCIDSYLCLSVYADISCIPLFRTRVRFKLAKCKLHLPLKCVCHMQLIRALPLLDVRGKLAESQSFSWCVKLGVTTMAAIARPVLVGDRISWHAASETVSHSAPRLLPRCSCQLT